MWGCHLFLLFLLKVAYLSDLEIKSCYFAFFAIKN